MLFNFCELCPYISTFQNDNNNDKNQIQFFKLIQYQAYNIKLALTADAEKMSSEQASVNPSPVHHPEQLITSDISTQDDIIKNVGETVTANDDGVTETLVNESDKLSARVRQGTLFHFKLVVAKQLLF